MNLNNRWVQLVASLVAMIMAQQLRAAAARLQGVALATPATT